VRERRGFSPSNVMLADFGVHERFIRYALFAAQRSRRNGFCLRIPTKAVAVICGVTHGRPTLADLPRAKPVMRE
jgi:hypothetical protein